MTQVINTNVLSLNAQRNLSTSGSALATALQRLSSGLRINSAKDDAAGLAIAERFTTQIRGLSQAARNANDGISLAQTGEGALAEITSNLQRIRELSVQAANSTNSTSDRAALDQEVQQRLAEIQRVSSQTSFNGQKILDGSFGNAAFQVGANAGETISIDLSTSTQTTDIGQIATANSGDISALFGDGLAVTAGDLTVAGQNVAAGNYTSAGQLVTAVNAAYTASGGSGQLAAVNGNEITFTNTTGSAIAIGGTNNTLGVSSVAAAGVTGAGLQITAGGFTVNGSNVATGTYSDNTSLALAINNAYTASGGSGTIASVSGSEISFSNSAGTAITFAGAQNPLGITSVGAATIDPPGYQVVAAGDFTVNGSNVAVGTYSDNTSLALAINNAFTASGGSGTLATVSGTEISFSNATGTAISLGGSNNPLGITTVAAQTVDPAGLQLAAGELTIDGTDVTGSFTDAASLAAAINTAYGSSVAVVNGTEIDFVNQSASAITIGGTANPLGITTVAADPGTTIAAGGFTIDGTDITGTFYDVDDVVTAINNNVTLQGSSITAVNSGGELRINNASGGAIAIGGAFQTTFGIANSVADASFEVSTAAATTLDTDTTVPTTGVTAAVADAGSTTPGAALSTTVNTEVTDAGLTTPATGLSTGVNAAVTDPGTPANGTATTTGVNTAVTAVGTTPLALATGDFTVQVGTNSTVDLAGSYANGQAFADAINAKAQGAFASFDSATGQITLASGQAVALGGARNGVGTGGNGLGFTATALAANSGSLSAANVTSTANANTTILRVDAALTSIGSLRGALGAIQNRFESTITNLTTAGENLTASRSRIQDADFAAETASLTRAQILQQAGTAILAQANAVPQNVLSLLR